MKVMALIPNYYGFGKDANEAKKNLKKVSGTIKNCGIYVVPDDYYLDDFGYAHGSQKATFVSGTNYAKEESDV